MGILDGVQPDKRYDRTHAAIQQLKESDREQILEAIRSDKYTDKTLARILTNHSDERVDHHSVSKYRAKLANGTVNL